MSGTRERRQTQQQCFLGARRQSAALAKVTDALQAEARELWRGGIAPTQVRDIAFELAQATLIDPRNLDVLHNLALLFQYAGEASRARLA